MKLTNWLLNFDFRTRARRSHYWANVFSWLGIWLVFLFMFAGLATSGDKAASAGAVTILLWVVAIFLSAIDGIAMVFRRAHDTGRSGWIWLLLLIPIVNLLPLYWLLIEDSQQGPNKYGPPVKQFYEPTAAST